MDKKHTPELPEVEQPDGEKPRRVTLKDLQRLGHIKQRAGKGAPNKERLPHNQKTQPE